MPGAAMPCILDCSSVENLVDEHQGDGHVTWVFQHIPKTGGTSLWSLVAPHLRPSCNVFVPLDLCRGQQMDFEAKFNLMFSRFLSAHQEHHFCFVSGHFERIHIEQLSQFPAIRLATILREPASRLLSSYRYQQSPKHPDHVGFRTNFPTFESFYTHPHYLNEMTRIIGGPGATAVSVRNCCSPDIRFAASLSCSTCAFQFLHSVWEYLRRLACTLTSAPTR